MALASQFSGRNFGYVLSQWIYEILQEKYNATMGHGYMWQYEERFDTWEMRYVLLTPDRERVIAIVDIDRSLPINWHPDDMQKAAELAADQVMLSGAAISFRPGWRTSI
jgi:hypothetical protein